MKSRTAVIAAGHLTRRMPSLPGLHRLIDACFPAEAFARSEDIVFRSNDSILFHANLHSHLERSLFFFGHYNRTVELSLLNRITPGAVVFDCGANVGMYTLRFAQAVGEEGRVFAVEPHELSLRRLEANAHLNQLASRIKFIDKAVAEKPGSVAFHYPPEGYSNQGNASLYISENNWITKLVETTTIDALFEESSMNRFDLMRIDVQGAEMRCLMGASITIQRFHPVISLLYNERIARSSQIAVHDEIRFLREFGYEAYHLKGHRYVPILKGGLSGSHNEELLFLDRDKTV